jgi:hypothetical protein
VKDNCSRTGWDVFRWKHTHEVRDEGHTGKAIASQLGDRWRRLSKPEKNVYGFQAFALQELNKTPDHLDRSSSQKNKVQNTEFHQRGSDLVFHCEIPKRSYSF